MFFVHLCIFTPLVLAAPPEPACVVQDEPAILQSEYAEWRASLPDDYPQLADYRHEGITWTMNLLARAAVLYPDHPRADEWLELAKYGYASSLSVDADSRDAEYIFSLNDMKNIAYAYWLHQVHGFARPVTQDALDRAHGKVFHSPHAKFVCVRDPSRFASWGWGAGKARTTGLILPRGHGLGDHLAQWDSNLRPDYWTVDKDGKWNYLHSPSATRQVETFGGGFAVSERSEFVRKGSDSGEPVLLDHRVMVAIPDGRTVLFAVSGRVMQAVRKLSTTDVNWRFVRSIFSDMQRTIYHAGGRQECRHVHDVPTPWLNVDGILGVVSIGRPMRISCKLLDKVDEKGAPVAERSSYGVHCGQTVRLGVRSLAPGDFERGQNVLTVGVAFVTDVSAEETQRLVTTFREEKPSDSVRVYHVRGQDGKEYVVAVNFADSEETVEIADSPTVRLLTPKAANTATKTDRNLQLRLVPHGCAVLAPLDTIQGEHLQRTIKETP